MNEEEFIVRRKELLDLLPEELRDTISYMAYDRCHAYGYYEELNILEGLVYDLFAPLEQLIARVKNESR